MNLNVRKLANNIGVMMSMKICCELVSLLMAIIALVKWPTVCSVRLNESVDAIIKRKMLENVVKLRWI